MADDAIRHETFVQVPPGAAWRLFTEGFGRWWPPAYTWSQSTLVSIGIEPHSGGRCSETGPNGFQCDWGRVLAYEPPESDRAGCLLLAWHISPNREPQPNPAQASTVEIRFQPADGGTRVLLEHRDFANHGDGADDYRAALGSEYGWPHILACFATAAI